MMRLPPHRRRKPDFSLATINIVFLLLLFFLVAGSIAQRAETGIEVPVAASLPLENLPRPLLMILDGPAFHLDGTAVSAERLIEEARARTAVPGTFLNILAERQMPARPMLETIELMASAGIPVRIVTIRSDGPSGGGGI